MVTPQQYWPHNVSSELERAFGRHDYYQWNSYYGLGDARSSFTHLSGDDVVAKRRRNAANDAKFHESIDNGGVHPVRFLTSRRCDGAPIDHAVAVVGRTNLR